MTPDLDARLQEIETRYGPAKYGDPVVLRTTDNELRDDLAFLLTTVKRLRRALEASAEVVGLLKRLEI